MMLQPHGSRRKTTFSATAIDPGLRSSKEVSTKRYVLDIARYLRIRLFKRLIGLFDKSIQSPSGRYKTT